jgi:hypothetical protein
MRAAVGFAPYTVVWFGELPFFPRQPLYMLHIAQLVLGIVCLRLSFVKRPMSDRTGRLFFNQGLGKVAMRSLGIVALLFSVSGFFLDWFWHFS